MFGIVQTGSYIPKPAETDVLGIAVRNIEEEEEEVLMNLYGAAKRVEFRKESGRSKVGKGKKKRKIDGNTMKTKKLRMKRKPKLALPGKLLRKSCMTNMLRGLNL